MSSQGRRLQDWPTRLAMFLAEGDQAPFVWGSRDCCTAACDLVERMTGLDPMAELRGQYDSPLSAARVLGPGGLATTVEELASVAGFVRVPVLTAQRGDLVLVMVDDAPALGFVDLAGRITVPAQPRGWRTFPLRSGLRAWRVD